MIGSLGFTPKSRYLETLQVMSVGGRSARKRDRRGADRPKPGDVRSCPNCARGRIEFNERYRLGEGPTPAWLCDNPACGFVHIVRSRRSALEQVLTDAKRVEAIARRSAMKARAQIERARTRIAQTKVRIKDPFKP